jgi:hypothetical protein
MLIYQILAIVVVLSLISVFSPIYLIRRKTWQMADEDLKKIDYEEWKKQIKSNAYIKLASREIWGLVLLSGYVINFQKAVAIGYGLLAIFVVILGVSFIVWGILGFRSEMKKFSEIK